MKNIYSPRSYKQTRWVYILAIVLLYWDTHYNTTSGFCYIALKEQTVCERAKIPSWENSDALFCTPVLLCLDQTISQWQLKSYENNSHNRILNLRSTWRQVRINDNVYSIIQEQNAATVLKKQHVWSRARKENAHFQKNMKTTCVKSVVGGRWRRERVNVSRALSSRALPEASQS